MELELTLEIELLGGLGNQLFGFAAGVAASQRIQTELLLNTSQLSHRGYQLPKLGISIATTDAFRIQKSKRLEEIIWKLSLKKFSQPVKMINEKSLFTETEKIVDKRFFNIENNTYIRGYYQSVQYFEQYRDKITQSLTLNIQNNTQAATIRSDIGKNPWTAVHVRRGDYLDNLEVFQLTSKNYYKNAVQVIDVQNKKMNYVVFSDDIDLAKNVFPNGYLYIGPKELSDPGQILILMSCADNLIASNSSLSWWAAYLSKMDHGLKIFPRPWFLSDLKKDSDILLPEWISLGN
jgi:hypothetical protein